MLQFDGQSEPCLFELLSLFLDVQLATKIGVSNIESPGTFKEIILNNVCMQCGSMPHPLYMALWFHVSSPSHGSV